MEPWMRVALWSAVIVLIAGLWFRERRSGRKAVDFDPYASRGQADDEARTRANTQGPGNLGPNGF